MSKQTDVLFNQELLRERRDLREAKVVMNYEVTGTNRKPRFTSNFSDSYSSIIYNDIMDKLDVIRSPQSLFAVSTPSVFCIIPAFTKLTVPAINHALEHAGVSKGLSE
jgi:hypothetical protein